MSGKEDLIMSLDMFNKLLEFLREKNVYDKFLNNINHESLINHIIKIRKERGEGYEQFLITSAFWWDESREGFMFWNKIDDTWRQYLQRPKPKTMMESLW